MHEALALAEVGNGESDHVAEARPLGAMGERRRGGKPRFRGLEHPPLGRIEAAVALDRAPQLTCPLRLTRIDHAPGVLGPYGAPAVEARVVAEMILVVVTQEDRSRPLGIGRDAVVGPAQGFPLLV